MADMSVLGTAPVAAWCPSLDTAGNGTTTLTDLSGNGNNGTLTNMDAATDWVADTAAGGVRALDFDGVNDYVDCGASVLNLQNSQDFTISMWFQTRTIALTQLILSQRNNNPGGVFGAMGGAYGAKFGLYTYNAIQSATTTLAINTWYHGLIVHHAATNTFDLYVDNGGSTVGVPDGTFSANANTRIGNAIGVQNFNGLVDDIRIFDTALTAPGIAYLYNSGNGRGVQPAVVSTHPFHPLQRGSTHPLRYT
jgi:hypothetical protein